MNIFKKLNSKIYTYKSLPYIGVLIGFLFQDDTKIKIECVTEAMINKEGKVITHRKFYTFRSLCSYILWYFTKNPYELTKKYLKDLQYLPEYRLRFIFSFLSILLTLIYDIKNIHNICLIGGSVAYTSVSGQKINAYSGDISFSHTVSGSNTMLCVSYILWDGGGPFTVSPKYNNVSMTQATGMGGGGYPYLGWYYLASPTDGTNSVTGTCQANQQIKWLCSISFSGANGDIDGSTAGLESGSHNYISVSITTSYANTMCACIGIGSQSATYGTSGSGQTGLFNAGVAEGYGAMQNDIKPSTTAGSQTMGWTGYTYDTWNYRSMIGVRELAPSGPANLKTINGVAKASIKTINGVAIASVKTFNGLN
jgi:hypothetical protein